MSELIAKSTGEIRARDALLGYWWYEKFEADKVIAGLKDKLRHYPIMAAIINDAERELAQAAYKIRHHKYKRCLDEAKICQLRHDRYEQYVTKYTDCNGSTSKRWRFLKNHYEKWHKHWMKLAEKFKECV